MLDTFKTILFQMHYCINVNYRFESTAAIVFITFTLFWKSQPENVVARRGCLDSGPHTAAHSQGEGDSSVWGTSLSSLATWSTNITNAHKVAIYRKWTEPLEEEPCVSVESGRLSCVSAVVVILERSLLCNGISYSSLMYNINCVS